MSYLTTKNQYITVQGNQIAYRELSKGKSKLPPAGDVIVIVHFHQLRADAFHQRDGHGVGCRFSR